jgi:predicted DNA-binding transcriptional regulator YafY
MTTELVVIRKEKNMSKFQRLFSILFYINRNRKVTANELSNEFGVSVRTIQRDLAELEEWGMPLYSKQGPHGGYTVLKNNILPPLFFTEDEGLALYFSYEHLMHYQTLPFQTEIKAASDKLYLSFNDTIKKKINEIKNHISFWTPPQKVSAPFLNDVLGSAVSQKQIAKFFHMAFMHLKGYGIVQPMTTVIRRTDYSEWTESAALSSWMQKYQ